MMRTAATGHAEPSIGSDTDQFNSIFRPGPRTMTECDLVGKG